MTANETKKYNQLLTLVSSFEQAQSIALKDTYYEKILSVINLDKDHLENYWRSMSIEEFCIYYSIDRETTGYHNKNQIIEFIHTIFKHKDHINKFEYFFNKYESAIEHFYQKPTGTLSDLIFFEDIESAEQLIKKLS